MAIDKVLYDSGADKKLINCLDSIFQKSAVYCPEYFIYDKTFLK